MLEIHTTSNGRYVVAEYDEELRVYRAPLAASEDEKGRGYICAVDLDDLDARSHDKRGSAQNWLAQCKPTTHRISTLARLREAAGLSRDELADRAQMCTAWIADLETGISFLEDWPKCVRKRLADALGVTVHELMG